MTTDATPQAHVSEGNDSRTAARTWLKEPNNIHFVLALAILLAVGGFIQAYGWMVKKPVKWPEGVTVEMHRNTSFPNALPAELGRYVAVTEDDPLYGVSKYQDGCDRIIKKEDLSVLGIRTIYNDQQRLKDHEANWYGLRYYRDTQADPNSPFRYWLLEVYYYTGLRDQVPHVPNTCLNAAGADILKQESIVFRSPNAREPWNGDLRFQRVFYTVREAGGVESFGVTYYLLGFNDEPINHKTANGARWDVRNRMSSMGIVYNYYVKIQFASLGNFAQGQFDHEQSDQAAQKFVESFMPEILTQLPTKEAIEKLEQAEKAADN